jgi:hypothetical protein
MRQKVIQSLLARSAAPRELDAPVVGLFPKEARTLQCLYLRWTIRHCSGGLESLIRCRVEIVLGVVRQACTFHRCAIQ